jgi:Zn-dependent membrane protease YugP
MHFVILLLLILAVVFGPQYWARHVLRRYQQPRDDFPGTGAELARHLLDRFAMQDVKVEETPHGDHYDPEARAVRLGKENFSGRSLTAITVAAHEVGHAIQDKQQYQPLSLRTRLVRTAQAAEKAGSVAMLAIPVVAMTTRSPAAGLAAFLVGLLSLGMSTIVHLVTLPVEWDASFGKALPVLRQGGYLSQADEAGARRILTACALTYVAGSLASLLNMWRWIAILRR